MNEQQKTAMELALQALEWVIEQAGGPNCEHESGGAVCFCKEKKAMTALREALAHKEPEQEPMAYINVEQRKLEWANKYMSWHTPTVVNLPKIPLYTTPYVATPRPQRTWVGLTDEDDINWDGTGNLKQLVEAIEAKLKELNT